MPETGHNCNPRVRSFIPAPHAGLCSGALQQLAGQKRQLPQINALAYLQQLLYIFCFLSCGTDSAYSMVTGCQAPVLRTVQDASVLLVTAQLVNS